MERARRVYPEAPLVYTIDVGHNNVPAGAKFLIVDADYIFPVRGLSSLPRSKVILSEEHPQQYLPYQYEGFSPRERAILREANLTMRVVRVERP
jgi:hypothetical protein